MRTRLLLSALALALLAACGSTAAAIPPTTTADEQGHTPHPLPRPTLDLSKNYGGWPPEWLAYDPAIQAIATAASQRVSAHQTAIALLTPTPTRIPQPTWSPQPTPTLGAGLISDNGCVYPVHSGAPMFPSCWHTRVAGSWFFVAAGSQGDGIDQPIQGLLWVSTQPYPHNPKGSDQQFYPAPRPDLHITAVDGPRITLAARDPTVPDTFVFDISTFQWVNP